MDIRALLRRAKEEKARGATADASSSPRSSARPSTHTHVRPCATHESHVCVCGHAHTWTDLRIHTPADDTSIWSTSQVGGVPTVLLLPGAFPPPAAHTLACEMERLGGGAGGDSDLGCDPGLSWITLPSSRRRLLALGGTVTPGGLQGARPLPRALQRLAQECVRCGLFPPDKCPNHALVNDYPPGIGIMPHTDGPAYYPRVVTISLLSSATMVFKRGRREHEGDGLSHVQDGATAGKTAGMSGEPDIDSFSLTLTPGSLVCFTHEAYSRYLHSIEPVAERRMSITLRYVEPANVQTDVVDATTETALPREE